MKTNKNIIGYRFGTLTPVEQIEGTQKFRCVCDCGNQIIVTRSQLTCYNRLSCGKCGQSRPTIKAKYGTISNYIEEGRVCAFCGSPYVYSKKHSLCKSCYTRLTKNGTPDYVRNEEYWEEVARRDEEKNQKKVLRRKQLEESIRPAPGPTAELMAKLYIEGGLSYQQVAKIFGLSRQRVHEILHYRTYKTKREQRAARLANKQQ